MVPRNFYDAAHGGLALEVDGAWRRRGNRGRDLSRRRRRVAQFETRVTNRRIQYRSASAESGVALRVFGGRV